jgi:hypothetical protein
VTAAPFRVRSVPEGYSLQATAAGLGSSEVAEWDELALLDDGTRSAEFRLRGESAELAGSVTDASGAPVADARVVVRCYGRQVMDGPLLRTTSLADGSFVASGLHGQGAEIQVEAPGYALGVGTVALEEGHTARLTIVLDAGFTLRGRVTLPHGLSANRVGVYAHPERTVDELFSLYTTTDENGDYVLELVPPGLIVASASTKDAGGATLRAQTRIVTRAGEDRTWDVSFGSGPAIRGHARDVAGTPLVGWSVEASPASPGTTMSQAVPTDERGAFVIPDLADAPYFVNLYAPEDARRSMARAVGVARPGGDEVELVVRTERTPTAFLAGRYVDAEGAPVRPEQLWARRSDELPSAGNPTWTDDHRFRIGPMLAGEYELSASFGDGAPSVLHPFTIAEGEDLELGEIAVPPTGRARLVLTGPDGARLPSTGSLCLTEGRFMSPLVTRDHEVFESAPLRPGTYWLHGMSGSFVPAGHVEVVIRAHETTELRARLNAGRGVRLDFAVPPGEHLPREVRLEVRDASGVLLVAQSPRVQHVGDHELLIAFVALPLGTFTFEARSEEGLRAAGTLEVRSGGELPLVVEVVLAR